MKRLILLVIGSASAFALACGATIVIGRRLEAPLAATAAPIIPRPKPGPLADVIGHLQDEDMLVAGESLRAVADKDPAQLFVLLRDLPYFKEGEDAVRDAARKLPPASRESCELLNAAGARGWRAVAWESWVTAQIGKTSDAELLNWALEAAIDPEVFPNEDPPIASLVSDALQTRAVSFAVAVDQTGSRGLRKLVFRQVMRERPELALEIGRALLAGHGPGAGKERTDLLQEFLVEAPSVGNLTTTLAEAGEAGASPAGDVTKTLTATAYWFTPPASRQPVRDFIASQPAITRNSMLMGITNECAMKLPVEEMTLLLALSNSAIVQRQMLDIWLGKHFDLRPDSRGWIADLPTEPLRSQAASFLDEKARQRAAR